MKKKGEKIPNPSEQNSFHKITEKDGTRAIARDRMTMS